MSTSHLPEAPFAPPPHGTRLAPLVLGVLALLGAGAVLIVLSH